MPTPATQTAAVTPDGPKPTSPQRATPRPRLVATPTPAKALPAFARPSKPAAKGTPSQLGGTAAGANVAAVASANVDSSAGASAGASAGRVIPMRMPEPPSSLSPAAKARIKATQHAAATTASANAFLKTAKDHKDDAALAVTEPPEQANARAAADLVTELGKDVEPSPEIKKLCDDIQDAIKSQGPPDEDSLVKAEPLVERAGGVVNKDVNGNIESVDTKYGTLQKAPVGTPEQGMKIPDPPGVGTTPPLNAAQAKPDAIPPKDVSLDADAADSQARMDQAGMSTEPAMLVRSGPIAEAREAQGDLQKVAAEDPAKVLAEQHARLLKAGSDFAGLQHTALTLLQQSRGATIGHVAGQQHEFVGTDAQKRTAASNEANRIFTTTQSAVNTLLTDLPGMAKTLWTEGVASAKTIFKDRIKQVQDWIDDRHSGFWGTLVSVGDFLSGLPGWVSESYTSAQQAFADEICKTARETSIKVNTIVRTCENLITNAGAAIKVVFAGLKGNLAEWAEGQQREFGEKLTGLTKRAHEVRDNFNKELVQDASAAVQDVRETVYKLREKAKSLLGRVIDKVEQFLDDPAKFIIEGLLDLLGISPSAFWAVVAKIKRVIGDIARHPKQFANNLMDAIGKGFGQFFDNIKTHLFEGFIDWLTKGLASAGVSIPKDLSLKSVMTFILELMGITWPRIRKLLAEVAGEKNVALIEKVYSTVSQLIELGPAGIFHLLEQKLNPQSILDMIIHAAVDYLESAVLKAVVVRVALLFNPVGAIVEAIEAIYRVLKWIFQNAARIFRLIEALADGIADIVAGNISGMANAVEKALAGLIPPVIGFLADYFGLGDLPNIIRKQIEGLQDMVMSALKKVLVFLVDKGKALWSSAKTAASDAVQSVVDWWRMKQPFKGDDGSSHTLMFHGEAESAELVFQSTPTVLSKYILDTESFTPAQKKLVRIITAEVSKIAAIRTFKHKDPTKDELAGIESNRLAVADSMLTISVNLGKLLGGDDWGTSAKPLPISYPKPPLASYKAIYIGPKTETPIPQKDLATALGDKTARTDLAARLRKKDKPAADNWESRKYRIDEFTPTKRNSLPESSTIIGVTSEHQTAIDKKFKLMADAPGSPGGYVINDELKKYGLQPTVEHTDGDHVVEIQFGGANKLENLWPLDSRVNSQAGSRLSKAEVPKPDGTTISMSELKALAKKRDVWLVIKHMEE